MNENQSDPFGSAFIVLRLRSIGIAENKHTNFVFILADDFGWKDLHCTGSEFNESPNIDRLARRVIFEKGYAASQVCSLASASILTGKFTARHGVTNWIGEASGENWRNAGRHTNLTLLLRKCSSRQRRSPCREHFVPMVTKLFLRVNGI